ncbi:MAG TPA: sigma-70 family RNA polymerase sigma factor [Bacteroidales bacterium]|nr:sigma-70 family RNA polymerase sigma factor [Bacteroidales bacterium]
MPLWIINRDDEKHTDKQLLNRYISSGNLNDLGTLYSRYMHLVYGVCLKYFREREESQDAVMEIFEKIIVELGKQPVENFKSWLYVLTKNFCLMRLRSKQSQLKRNRKFEETAGSFMENREELHPVDKEEVLTDKALKDCIDELKEEQKRCIELFYYNSKCYREIAEDLCMDEKKVKSHLQNAKRNLKICLEASDDKEE